MADYSVAYDQLMSLLQGLAENTSSTPYEIEITSVTSNFLKGKYQPGTSTNKLQDALYSNPKKYVSITWSSNAASTIRSTTDVSYMVARCPSLISIDLSSFTAVTNANLMFLECTSLTSINASAMTSITDAGGMFSGCSALSSVNISGLTSVTNAGSMFGRCTSLVSVNISSLISVTNTSQMFFGCSALESIDVSVLSNTTDSSQMFKGCISLESIDLSGFTSVTDVHNMFEGCTSLETADISSLTSVTAASYMFKDCTSIENIDASSMTLVNSATSMFEGCTSLETVDISSFLSLRSSTYRMFFGCSALKNVNMPTSSSVMYARQMFFDCSSLESIDLSGFTSITDAFEMFQNCSSLESIDMTWAASVTGASQMFYNCSSLESMNVSSMVSVTSTRQMFDQCSDLKTITLPYSPSVVNAEYMFRDCTSLEEIHGWSIPLTATMTDCFKNCDSLQAIYVPEVAPQESTWHAWEMSKDTANSQTAVKVYNLDGTSVSVNVQSTGTYSIKVTDKVDELIFASTAGTITSAMIQKMLQIKAPITGRESALDPTNDNFVLWAKNQQAIKTNIVTNVVEANNPLPPSSAAVHAAIAGGIPTGTILDYPGTIAPAGFALCIGQTAMRSEYINLIQWAIENDLIGENKLFGDGDGVSTFEFPDLREVVLVGSGKNERYVFDNTELDPATGTAGTQAHDIYNVGEFKDDQMQKITGTFESARAASAGNTTGAFYTSSEFSSDYLIGASGSAVRHSVYGLDTSRVVRAGTVTHSKQIGMNYIIRC